MIVMVMYRIINGRLQCLLNIHTISILGSTSSSSRCSIKPILDYFVVVFTCTVYSKDFCYGFVVTGFTSLFLFARLMLHLGDKIRKVWTLLSSFQ